MGGLIRPGWRAAVARARVLRSGLFGSAAAVARACRLRSAAAVARASRLRSAAVVALLAGAAGLAAGCGGERGPSDTDQVRATLVQFGRATARRDYQTMCDRLLAPALVEKLSQIGLPCVQTLEQGLGDVRAPKLTVGRITVRGDRARAVVRTSAEGQQPSEDTVELRRVNGSWRIASLAGAGG